MFKTKFKKYVTIIQNSCNFLWCKLSKEVSGCKKDVYICGLYIQNRLCLVCNSDQIENKIHLIFSCSCYDEHRAKMINVFKNMTKQESCQNYHEIHFLTKIIQSKNPSVIRLFCKFIANCFHERKCKLDA